MGTLTWVTQGSAGSLDLGAEEAGSWHIRVGTAPPLSCPLELSCRTDDPLKQEGVSGPCPGERAWPGARPPLQSGDVVATRCFQGRV